MPSASSGPIPLSYENARQHCPLYILKYINVNQDYIAFLTGRIAFIQECNDSGNSRLSSTADAAATTLWTIDTIQPVHNPQKIYVRKARASGIKWCKRKKWRGREHHVQKKDPQGVFCSHDLTRKFWPSKNIRLIIRRASVSIGLRSKIALQSTLGFIYSPNTMPAAHSTSRQKDES